MKSCIFLFLWRIFCLDSCVAQDGPERLNVNRWARYIAGIDAFDSSDTQYNSPWNTYKQRISAVWKTCKNERLKFMQNWAEDYVSAPPLPIFYPFSGPDVQTPLSFFPDTPLIIMVGLEPVGNFLKQDITQWIKDARNHGFYESTLSGMLKRSFFITEHMKKDLKNGLIPVLLGAIARHGYFIEQASYIQLLANGEVVENHNNHPNAVKITFSKKNKPSKTLIYLQANLMDGNLPKGLKNFLNKQKVVNTLIKSCSYALHYSNFSEIKKKILEKSFLIIQDDTGIPFKDIEDKKWSVELYGKYQSPVNIFSHMLQPDLKQAYLTGQTKPLNFPIGYGYKNIPSNLVILERK